jgi:hypothetical protein
MVESTNRYSRLADKQFQSSSGFRRFRRQLFHSSLACIFSPLKPWMTQPKVTLCADGHFRRVIYGLGPYIADYPEQVLLSLGLSCAGTLISREQVLLSLVVSGWCPMYVQLMI